MKENQNFRRLKFRNNQRKMLRRWSLRRRRLSIWSLFSLLRKSRRNCFLWNLPIRLFPSSCNQKGIEILSPLQLEPAKYATKPFPITEDKLPFSSNKTKLTITMLIKLQSKLSKPWQDKELVISFKFIKYTRSMA